MELEIKHGNLTARITGENQRDIFEQLASFQEVFCVPQVINGVTVAPEDIAFRVRVDEDENKYYEAFYCGSDKELMGFKRRYGCTKKGNGLFPKWKVDEDDADDYENGQRGWFRWKGDSKKGKFSGKNGGKSRRQDDDEDDRPSKSRRRDSEDDDAPRTKQNRETKSRNDDADEDVPF